MKVMTNYDKIIRGIPIRGNNINRQMKAVKRATWIHISSGAAMATFALMNYANRNMGMFAFDGIVGSLCYYNAAGMMKKSKALYPQYAKIVERAKRIFKK